MKAAVGTPAATLEYAVADQIGTGVASCTTLPLVHLGGVAASGPVNGATSAIVRVEPEGADALDAPPPPPPPPLELDPHPAAASAAGSANWVAPTPATK